MKEKGSLGMKDRRKWQTYHDLKLFILYLSVMKTVMTVFQLVEHFLGYLTASIEKQMIYSNRELRSSTASSSQGKFSFPGSI